MSICFNDRYGGISFFLDRNGQIHCRQIGDGQFVLVQPLVLITKLSDVEDRIAREVIGPDEPFSGSRLSLSAFFRKAISFQSFSGSSVLQDASRASILNK